MPNLDLSKPDFEKVLEHLKLELGSLRGTRATPALVDDLMVEVYGAQQPLKALASISVADPKTLTIEPWDKSILKDIERAIQAANKGFSPVNDGQLLRIIFPPLTEESRKELVKIAHTRMEESRNAIKSVREKLRQMIIDEEKNKKISEDEKFRQLEKLDKITGEYNDKLKSLGEHKEKEIMTV